MRKQVWITKHKGKLYGIRSIGTCCCSNPHCLERIKNGNSVCAHCYAAQYIKMRRTLKEHLEDNVEVLTTRLLTDREIPFIYDRFFRFESFGDLHNAVHLQNYCRIAELNPETNFALWTKNKWILSEVFETMGIAKPDNLQIVYSSYLLNTPDKADEWYIDKIFTVYDAETIESENIEINCGKKICVQCGLCYKKNTIKYINEKLK